MTEIVAGKLVYNESTKNANGGTELMARRMVENLDSNMLKDFQIIHSRVRDLDPNLKKILVCHDLHNDPEVSNLADPEYRKNFEKIVFVSNWQAQMYNMALGIPYDDFVVIPNAVESFDYVPKKFDGTINLIYHTTPHRGLELLVPVFETLSEHIPDIHLDVYSSFKAYGWEDRDLPYKKLFDRLDELPNATNHGFQPNRVVREALHKAHIFAYPSIWPETSCIAAIEAMCAGCIVVHPNLAALPETCEHGSVMYQFTEDKNKHANRFLNTLYHVVTTMKNQPEFAKTVAHTSHLHYNRVYELGNNIQKWNNLLKALQDGKDC